MLTKGSVQPDGPFCIIELAKRRLTSFIWLAELLDKVKNWEESELSGQPLNEKAPTLSPKKKLAPLNEGGPMQLLNLQGRYSVM